MAKIKDRTWIIDSDDKPVGTEGEFTSETVTIEVDRYTDSGKDKDTGSAFLICKNSEGVIFTQDVTKDDTKKTEETITYKWDVGLEVTNSVGDFEVAMQIDFTNEDGTADARWKSEIGTFTVHETLSIETMG